jgi:hypothetical protein
MPRPDSYAGHFMHHYAKNLVERLELVPQGDGTYRLSWGREKVSAPFEMPLGEHDRDTLRMLAQQVELFLEVR